MRRANATGAIAEGRSDLRNTFLSRAELGVRAPRIAGSPPDTNEDFIRLMTTGIARTGKPPNPPRPDFRMTRADAEAVLAYLKSL